MATKKVPKKSTKKSRSRKATKKRKKVARRKPAGKTKKVVKKKTKKKTKKTKRKSKAASKKTRKKTGTTKRYVTIASDVGQDLQIPSGSDLRRDAMRWRYILSRRQRWQHSSRTTMRDEAHQAFVNLCSSSDDAKRVFTGASVVQVQVPYRSERQLWEGRVAPWEFILGSTASGLGNTDPLTIVRHLQTGRTPLPPLLEPRVLYVECAPGYLSDFYDFTTERGTLERTFEGVVDACLNPTVAGLRAKIADYNPNIIHIAGIDNNQAKEILQDEDKLPADWPDGDGLVFAADNRNDELGLVPVGAEELAQVLNCASEPVHLVAANVYHSASRICALAVAEGAELAIGFQDTVRDSLAEVFLREFYTNWTVNHETLPAFVSALDIARTSIALSGTGIVLWSAQSLLDGSATSIQESREIRNTSREAELALDGDYENWFRVTIGVRDRLNYSLLHNDSGGLFHTLEFRKDREGVLRDVSVEVILYLGSESHPYNATYKLTEYLTEIHHEIKIPLTSSLIRTVSEAMRTSLYVKISVGDVTVCEETHRVTLLPADEWKDSDADRIWLPSFVLPRDPAIERIVDRAQNHLVTLADDHKRGFDGYQAIDPNEPDILDDVDLQVHAIWAAVVSDFGVRYINPPPSYSSMGQRLRTPTQVIRGGRGTCIDLAILLCACLEYIEIYPAIFLLAGHAFAGYWRSEERHDLFMEGRQGGVDDVTLRESIGATTVQASPWILPSDSYAEILNEVNSGYLFPIETVGFTTHGSFWEAIEEGVDNLRSRSEFHSLIDIWLARREFITPLPVIDEILHGRGGYDND